jgi:hypothetical protein
VAWTWISVLHATEMPKSLPLAAILQNQLMVVQRGAKTQHWMLVD